MRYVIVNADDFGYSPGVNTAVLRAHREGILTSASLMVAEAGYREAVEIARRTPSLGVGLHVSVTYDHALLDRRDIPRLVGPDGRFGADPMRVALRYTFSSAARGDLRREMEAQFERFAETGLPWSHVDGHQHFHMHPAVWDLLMELCDRHGVHRVRVPCEELNAHLRQGGDGFNLNTAAALFLRLLRRRALRLLRARRTLGGRPFFVCDRVYGQLQTGNMTPDYTRVLLTRLTGRTNEVYFHPGSPHARALPDGHCPPGVTDVDYLALLDPGVRAEMARLSLQPGRYEDVEYAALGRSGRVEAAGPSPAPDA